MTRKFRHKLLRRIGLALAVAALVAPAAQAARGGAGLTSVGPVVSQNRPVPADSPVTLQVTHGGGAWVHQHQSDTSYLRTVSAVSSDSGNQFAYGDALVGAALASVLMLMTGIGLIVRRNRRLAIG